MTPPPFQPPREAPGIAVPRAARKMRAARRQNKRKPDWLAPVRFVVLLLLIGQCVRVVFTADRLNLEQVVVSGTSRLTSSDVERVGKIPVGGNIFAVNLASIRDRLLADPIAREVTVRREMPNRVVVHVTDRTPAYHLVTQRGRYLADADGLVFQQAPATPSTEVVQVGLPVSVVPEIGKTIPPGRLATIRECLALARRESIDLRYLRLDKSGEVWLSIVARPTLTPASGGNAMQNPEDTGNLKVRLGRPTELDAKFRDIRQTLAALPNLALVASHLDVMCAGRPSYRVKEITPGEPAENRPVTRETASIRP